VKEEIMRVQLPTGLRTSLTLLWLIILAASLNAGERIDPSGSWLIVVNRPGRPRSESTLKLERSGDTFVGIMMDAQGRATPIRDAQLKDGELSFRIKIQRDGRDFSFTYKGKVTPDAFNGVVSINVLGINRSAPFEGKRKKSEGALSGLWRIAIALEDGQKLQPTLKLQQAADNLSGQYVGARGKETVLKDLKFKDGEVSFQVADEVDGDNLKLRYTGKLVGEKITGTVRAGEGSQAVTLRFQAQKMQLATADIAGTWKLKVPFQSGINFGPTIKLVQTGSSLAGTYTGDQGDTPIADALIFGDEFTFEVNREKDGKKYKLRYQGKANGDTIKGGVDYDFDGMVGTLDFEGKRVVKSSGTR
jgi:hypothetical protein